MSYLLKRRSQTVEHVLRAIGDDEAATVIRGLRDERDAACQEASAAALRAFRLMLNLMRDYSTTELRDMLEQEAQAHLRGER